MDNNIPAGYDYQNIYNADIRPSTVHVTNTTLQWYFRKYLLQKAISVFKWELPEDWSRDYMLYVLYCWGKVAIINTDKYGVIPQGCGLRGYDVFYRPTHAIISNPLLTGIIEPEINRQCVVLKLQPDYSGIMDIVNYYADLMALASESLGVSLVNSKLSYVFASGDKTTAESFKKMYDKINSGEPAVFVAKDLFREDGQPNWEPFLNSVGSNYIADRLLSDMRKIEAMFDTEIGIPNANTDKRERLITDEVNANNVETAAKCELWLEELKKEVARANDMFGLSLSVDWRNDPYAAQEGGINGDAVDFRTV